MTVRFDFDVDAAEREYDRRRLEEGPHGPVASSVTVTDRVAEAVGVVARQSGAIVNSSFGLQAATADSGQYDKLTAEIENIERKIDSEYARLGTIDSVMWQSTALNVELFTAYSSTISDLLRRSFAERTQAVLLDLIRPRLEEVRSAGIENFNTTLNARDAYVGHGGCLIDLNEENRRELREKFAVVVNALIEDFSIKLVISPSTDLKALQEKLDGEKRGKHALFCQMLDKKTSITESLESLKKARQDLLTRRRGSSSFLSNKWAACTQGHLAYLQKELEREPWWNKRWFIKEPNKDGTTLIHLASSRAPSHDASPEALDRLVVWLIQSGAVCDEQNKEGYQPLHLAAKVGNVLVARTLLQANACINALGADGKTPLHEAVINRKEEIVALFMDVLTLDVKVRDSANHSPFYYAIAGGVNEIAGVIIGHDSWRGLSSDPEDAESIPNLLTLPSCRGDEIAAVGLRDLLKRLSK